MAEGSFLVKNKEIFTSVSFVSVNFPYLFLTASDVFVSKDT